MAITPFGLKGVQRAGFTWRNKERLLARTLGSSGQLEDAKTAVVAGLRLVVRF